MNTRMTGHEQPLIQLFNLRKSDTNPNSMSPIWRMRMSFSCFSCRLGFYESVALQPRNDRMYLTSRTNVHFRERFIDTSAREQHSVQIRPEVWLRYSLT